MLKHLLKYLKNSGNILPFFNKKGFNVHTSESGFFGIRVADTCRNSVLWSFMRNFFQKRIFKKWFSKYKNRFFTFYISERTYNRYSRRR